MIVTLSGENDFLIRREINGLTSKFVKSADPLGLEVIDNSTLTIEELKQQLVSYSLLTPRKMIILIEPSRIKDFNSVIGEVIQSLPETTDLVIVEPNVDKRLSYYKELRSKTDFRLFSKLEQPALIRFIVSYANEHNAKISNRDASYLVDRVGDNQMLLAHEIEKLAIYAPDITTNSIDLLTERSIVSTIFQLLDAAFSGQAKQALAIYNEQRSLKIEPEEILAMVSWQLQTLALVVSAKNLSSDEVARLAKINPYVARKAMQTGAKLSFSAIRRLVGELSNIDYRSKRQLFDLDEAIKNFLISVRVTSS